MKFLKSLAGAAFVAGSIFPVSGTAMAKDLSDAAVRQLIIKASIASYSGSCPCPYNTDRGGRSCGGRSAYSRGGGAAPICYAKEISAAEVKAYRASR